MACDICGAKGTALADLRDGYRTAEIKSICPGCEQLVNRKVWVLRGLTDGFAKTLMKRFMRERRAQFLPTDRPATRRIDVIETLAAMTGLAGAFMLASNGEHAARGWLFFLASNAGWILFAWVRGHRWLLLQQLGFTATSLLGIWRWLL